LEARVISQGIEHWIESDQGSSKRRVTAGAAPSLCTNQSGQNYLSMTVFIHTKKDSHPTWLTDFLTGNITMSVASVGLLPAQITNLEYRYTAVRTRIERVSGATMNRRTESDRRI
jgi:hypothetical protein